MEAKILAALGKVAGLGGIALGVFLLLFRGVLQQKFLPQAGLDSAQAFAVILAMMILTFGIASIGLISWLVSLSPHPKAPIPPLALVVLAIALVLCAAVYVGVQARAGVPAPLQITDEDLLVSFQTALVKPDNLEVKYLLRNRGKQSALVNDVGLFEIVATKGFDDPQDNVRMCDDADAKTLTILRMGIMGQGAQVGDDSKRSGEYTAITLLVDGAPWEAKTPIPIESGKTRLITATFSINPDHAAHFNTRVFCPVIDAVDIRNIPGTTICRGMAQTFSSNEFTESRSMQQFRILPHSPGASCPVATR
jgi:hypothetical protein